MSRGLMYGLAAYGMWGLLTIFWKSLDHVPALEILSHRMVWSLVFVTLLLAGRRHWRWLNTVLRQPRVWFAFLGAGLLLTVNWGTYIWAVNADFIVETSLGYFINPLVNVLLGLIFFRERLRQWQWVAVAAAATGVLYLTLTYGRLPWIALTLAFTFGFYGVLKKRTSLAAVDGLFLETALLFLPALAYLGWQEWLGMGSFGHVSWGTSVLLALTGVATAMPLLAFAAAAKTVPLSTLGILQYLAPTMQLMIGVFIYGEPFDTARLVGFCFIWLALLIYSVDGFYQQRRRQLAFSPPA